MPDLSFHEDPGAPTVSQEQRREMPLPQETGKDLVSTTAKLEANVSKAETLSPRRQLLLSLDRSYDRRYFEESVDTGSPEALSALARILAGERTDRKQRTAILISVALLLGFGGAALGSMLSNDAAALVTAGAILTLIVLSLVAMYSHPIGRLERAAFDYLLSLNDKRSVGLLLEQRNAVLPPDQKRVDQVLVRLLPTIVSRGRPYG